MLRKKRFRMRTLGRLLLFFRSSQYCGWTYPVFLKTSSFLLSEKINYFSKLNLYKNCYKKKN